MRVAWIKKRGHMTVWAIADLHLSLGVEGKSMEKFGPIWKGYTEKIASQWRACVGMDDLVLIPGDISWAMRLDQVAPDIDWISALPGTKVILRGNHDYWWPSRSKLEEFLPKDILCIQNNALLWNNIAIGGSRLWDSSEYSFINFLEQPEALLAKERALSLEERENKEKEEERIFLRELQRLELSLQQMSQKADVRIALTHYPPIGAELLPSKTSEILEKYKINYSVFGHLHGVVSGGLPFGKARGVSYHLTSADYLRFHPLCILHN